MLSRRGRRSRGVWPDSALRIQATRRPSDCIAIRAPQTYARGEAAHQYLVTAACQNDPGLAAVIESWDRLPEAGMAGIVAIVKAAAK
jgi:hypothetical protein